MSHDIDDILNEWEYDPEKNMRWIQGKDGAGKIQIRVREGGFSGVLQMNIEGRPDGTRPYGYDYVLEYYQEMMESQDKEAESNTFEMDHESCVELFNEAYSIYGRYVFMLQIGEYEKVVRDTEHNLQICSFVKKYAARDSDKFNLEKWRPYVLRINATAKAMLCLRDKDYSKARGIIQEARNNVESLAEIPYEEFHMELKRSRKAFEDLKQMIEKMKPLSIEEKLEKELERLIKKEAYERAAVVRDQIRKMKATSGRESGGQPEEFKI